MSRTVSLNSTGIDVPLPASGSGVARERAPADARMDPVETARAGRGDAAVHAVSSAQTPIAAVGAMRG
jgi:hypothetical protein